MGRGKVTMAFIASEKERRHTFENRKKTLFKKAYELSDLCDVDVCVIINGFPTVDQRSNQLATWPENSEEVRRIIKKYEAKDSSVRRKMTSSLSSSSVEGQQNADERMTFPAWDSRVDGFSDDQTFKLLEEIDQKLAAVDKRMNELQTHNDQLPMIEYSPGEEQITSDWFTAFDSQMSQCFNDYGMDWSDDQNLDCHPLPVCPMNYGIFSDLPMEFTSENYNMAPEPSFCLQPIENYSTAASVPSSSSTLSPLPPSSTSSTPFLGHPNPSWPEFFDGGHGYQMIEEEEERFWAINETPNFDWC